MYFRNIFQCPLSRSFSISLGKTLLLDLDCPLRDRGLGRPGGIRRRTAQARMRNKETGIEFWLVESWGSRHLANQFWPIFWPISNWSGVLLRLATKSRTSER